MLAIWINRDAARFFKSEALKYAAFSNESWQ